MSVEGGGSPYGVVDVERYWNACKLEGEGGEGLRAGTWGIPWRVRVREFTERVMVVFWR